jgi:hypothetical protein
MKPQKQAPLVRPAFWLLPLLVLWIVSGFLGIGGALPYGGSNGFLDVFFGLTWAAILYVGYRFLRWMLGPLLRLMPRPQVEVDEEQAVEPMVICAACHTETPASNPVCQWCGRKSPRAKRSFDTDTQRHCAARRRRRSTLLYSVLARALSRQCVASARPLRSAAHAAALAHSF